MRESTIAPAHMAQGSSVTTSEQSVRSRSPRCFAAIRSASNSACEVPSPSRRMRFWAIARIAPVVLSTITAPTGTSPASAAARASTSATCMALTSTAGTGAVVMGSPGDHLTDHDHAAGRQP